ncbi:MAG: GNAT family N-acetyltransferase [Candidatus Methanomethylophilaceae archaeon]|nr:GNAT family N-acetyltransferase [Candidatus Methanomethylophilaceae archaeon]
MELVPLREGSPLLEEVSRINEEAFPPFERVSIEEMLSVPGRQGEGFCAIVEGGKAAGFLLYLLRSDVCFLGFLAVSEEMRSAGIGGNTLELLKSKMAGKRIFLNAESPGPEADIRTRRIGFYARHGLVPCGLRTEFAGTEWTVLCSGPLSREEYTALMNDAGTPFRFLA